jgi:hypothetical protein
MPKFITADQLQAKEGRAGRYLQRTVLYPSALFGLITLVIGYGGVFYLFFKRLANPSGVIIDSTVLLLAGGMVGLAQAFYHRHLYRNYSDYYSELQRRAEMRWTMSKIRKMPDRPVLRHQGRFLVPWIYLGLIGLYVALSIFYAQRLNFWTAGLLPLAGFYNARFMYWRRIFK